jgi:uncharacterized protein with GYD domain
VAYFCHQVSYTSDAWLRVVENPEDQFEAIRTTIERLGGQFRATFFTTGRFDVLAITEFADHVTPAEISTAFANGGAVASIQTIPLLTVTQVMEAHLHATQPDHPSFPRKRAATVNAGS